MSRVAIKATSIAIFLILLFFIGYMLVEPIRQFVYGEASLTDTINLFGLYPVPNWAMCLAGFVLIVILVKYGFGRLFR